jgi:hypothetical protein
VWARSLSWRLACSCMSMSSRLSRSRFLKRTSPTRGGLANRERTSSSSSVPVRPRGQTVRLEDDRGEDLDPVHDQLAVSRERSSPVLGSVRSHRARSRATSAAWR